MPLYFFFYGTLIAGSDNATAQAVHSRLRPVGAASVSGALWAIPDVAGWYPALVAGPSERAHGVLYQALAGFGAQNLARLDEWEDYYPDRPAASLYLREALTVTNAAGGSFQAQVYRFNQPLPGDAQAIPGGDFRGWLTANGYAAYLG